MRRDRIRFAVASDRTVEALMQAVRDETFEEAALACLRRPDLSYRQQQGADVCATAIRALIGTPRRSREEE